MFEQKTLGNAYLLGLNLEDTTWLLKRDIRKIGEFVDFALTEIEKDRRPDCRWWQFGCKRERKEE